MMSFGLVLLVIGALEGFLGYKLYKLWLAISGFVVGAVIGGIGGLIFGKEVAVMASLLLGVLFAIINVLLLKVGVFIHCFSTGYLAVLIPSIIEQVKSQMSLEGIEKIIISYFIDGNSGIDTTGSIILALLVGLIFGVIGVILIRPVIVICTGLVGGFLMSIGCSLISGKISIGFVLIFGLILAIFAILVQWKLTGKNDKEQKLNTNHQQADRVSSERMQEKGSLIVQNIQVGSEKAIQSIQQAGTTALTYINTRQQTESKRVSEKKRKIATEELMEELEAIIYQNKVMAKCMPFIEYISVMIILAVGIYGILRYPYFRPFGFLLGIMMWAPVAIFLNTLCIIAKKHWYVYGIQVIYLFCVIIGMMRGIIKFSDAIPVILIFGILFSLEYLLTRKKKNSNTLIQKKDTQESINASSEPENNKVFCSQCKTEMEKGDSFCIQCGNPLQS